MLQGKRISVHVVLVSTNQTSVYIPKRKKSSLSVCFYISLCVRHSAKWSLDNPEKIMFDACSVLIASHPFLSSLHYFFLLHLFQFLTLYSQCIEIQGIQTRITLYSINEVLEFWVSFFLLYIQKILMMVIRGYSEFCVIGRT